MAGRPLQEGLQVLHCVDIPPLRQKGRSEPAEAGPLKASLQDLGAAPGDFLEQPLRRMAQAEQIIAAVFGRAEDGLCFLPLQEANACRI